MLLCRLLLLVAALELPAVEVDTLGGAHHQGLLAGLTATTATLQVNGQPQSVPLAEILELRFDHPPATATPAATPADTPLLVTLVDGSRLACTRFSTQQATAHLTTTDFGELSLPVSQVANVRFGPPTTKLEDAWKTILQRESRKDLVVIKRNETLDHLAGVIGDAGDKIKFLLDGDEIPVAREKIYGLVYTRRTQPGRKPVCQIETSGHDLLQAAAISWQNNSLTVELAAGGKLTLPVVSLRSLDFSAGKVRYLSQLEPREVKYTPFFDVVWNYRRDRNLDGGPLRLAGKTYSRGLAIHSRTLLKYRLAGEFRRFQAVVGIDEVVDEGNVRLVISGDGRALFEADVSRADAPRTLDLDVTGVRELEILVDFGGNMDISDHLDLADARLLK